MLSKTAHAETSAARLLSTSRVHHHSEVEICIHPPEVEHCVRRVNHPNMFATALQLKNVGSEVEVERCLPGPGHRKVYGPCPKVELMSHRLGRQNAVTPIRESTFVRPVPGSRHPFLQKDPTGRVIRIGRRGTTK